MRAVDLQRSTARISQKTLERRAHEFKPKLGKCDLDCLIWTRGRPRCNQRSTIGRAKNLECDGVIERWPLI